MAAKKESVPRHSALVRLEHWLVAISGFVLVGSGFGQFPMFKRYNIVKLPGLAWGDNYWTHYGIHLWAAAVFVAAVVFHLVYHLRRRETAIWPKKGDLGESVRIMKAMITGTPEPPSGKFLAEQRLAYVFFGGTMLLLIATGLVKAWKNLPGNGLSPGMEVAMTMLHNLGTVLFLVALAAHLLALLIKPNRPLSLSMFTGKVDAAYARHRHPLWDPSMEAQAVEEEREKLAQQESKSAYGTTCAFDPYRGGS